MASEIAPTAFRVSQAAQFDVDYRDFVAAKTDATFRAGQKFPNPPTGKTQTMMSGPMSGEDIFTDRRTEGRRHHGR